MDVIHGQIVGPHYIDQNVIMHGMITAGARVASGVTIILHGMVTGDLDIEPGATAEIFGMVNGVVRNAGTATIHGWVDEIVELDGATTILTETSRVRGKNGGSM